MKEMVFRPLRRVKKTGKIVVAAYAQWNKVRTADYGAFRLTVDNEYAGLPLDEYVYNHEGQQLFWRDFNPADIPVYTPEEMRIFEITTADLFEKVPHHGIQWEPEGGVNYCVQGLDCCGTPTFSHGTAEQVVERFHFAEYEPLTVGVVVKWFGWFLYQLRNSELQIGR